MYAEFFNVTRGESLYLTGSPSSPRIEASNTLRANNVNNTIDPEQLLELPADSSSDERLKFIHNWFDCTADLFPGDSFQIRFFHLRPLDPVMTRRCETISSWWPVYRGNRLYTFEPVK